MRQQSFFSSSSNQMAGPPSTVSLIPYIRRLVATGHDSPGVFHGFFGDDWISGVGSLHEVERRNYLFAAKSTDWAGVKESYDISPQETIPFLLPLREVTEKELAAADQTWSEWISMQDWMLGPRAFAGDRGFRAQDNMRSPIVKTEPGFARE